MSHIVEEINHEELTGLIQRIEHAIEHDLALSVEDMKRLLLAITTLCTLQQNLENKEVTLHKLRKLLGIVQQSEQRKKQSKKDKPGQSGKKDKQKKNKSVKPPHIPVEHHPITEFQKGQACLDCGCGKLYKYESAKLLRITGHAPYEATQHITERLRCNACQKVVTAKLPAAVLADGKADQQYGYSARSLMAIHKFYSGIPYHHQGNLTSIFGYPVSASTIFDQCEYVANAVNPIVYELKRQASDAPRFLLDDTHHQILEQEPELRKKRNGKGTQLRTGVYSSGLIALTATEHEIVLFETSLGHAGELLDSVLSKRSVGLPAPLTMSDALSSNKPQACDVKQAYCNAHCRRQFFDIQSQHPEKIEWVLKTYSHIWIAEHAIKEQKLDAKQRLSYHQEHSLPAMEALYQWGQDRQQSATFEEHSPLGKAIKYLLRHYERLTLFCREQGALIDNNRMEETLKIIIRGRKTSHFFKTVNGAGIANVLTSLIATSVRANANIFEYLTVIQRHKKEVRAAPSLWLPWNYKENVPEQPESV